MVFESHYDVKDEVETLHLAEYMATHLSSGMNIYLQGELGAGKTTFVRGLLRGVGYHDKVKSPTYALIEPYSFEKFNIYHFDLYRFKDETEWDAAGFREYFNQNSICIVEWPEKAMNTLPKPDISIAFSYTTLGRHLHFMGYTLIGTACLKAIT